MNTFLYKVVLVFLVEFSINSRVFGQLDLPALPPASSAKPEVLINSYTSEKFENLDKKSDTNNLRYDRDRSSRFGPPYDSEDDEYPARGDRNYDRNRDRSRERNQGGEYYKDHGDEKFYQNNDRLSDPPLRDNDGNFRTNYDRVCLLLNL